VIGFNSEHVIRPMLGGEQSLRLINYSAAAHEKGERLSAPPFDAT
jgi:hypothetical protein